MFQNLRTLWILPLVAFGLFFLPGCKLDQQSPKELFADGKLPRSLERIANQRRELDEERIVKRMALDAQNRRIVVGGVIDNGVDLAHPFLMDRLVYRVENGRVVGAGFDAMGEDGFASANLIDPKLFAYTAESIKDGKIVHPQNDPNPDPLGALAQHQREFFEILKKNIAAEPSLAGTIIEQKLQINSFLFTDLIKRKTIYQSVLNQTPAQQAERNLARLPLNLQNLSDRQKENLNLSKMIAYRFLYENWRPDASESRSSVLADGIDLFQVYPDFLRVAFKSYEELDLKHQISERLKKVGQFNAQLSGTSVSESTAVDTGQKIVDAALGYKLGGAYHRHPLAAFLHSIRSSTLLRLLAQAESFPEQPIKLTRQSFEETLSELLNEAERRLRQEINEMKASDSIALERLRQLQRQQAWIRNVLEKQLASIPDQALIENRADRLPRNNSLDRYLLRTSHPYLNSSSNTTSHGTHVSGTIAIQHPDIRIEAIRVVTSSSNKSKEGLLNAQAEVRRQMKEWLLEPLVFRAFESRMKSFVTSVRRKEPNIQPTELVERFLASHSAVINSFTESNALTLDFFDQIMRGIEYSGEKKLKVVNMSLGMETKAPVTNSTGGSDRLAKMAQDFQFLFFEMMKYRVAKQMTDKAQGTLFVIAAGNSGIWVDAYAKSALPVDVSSPWLREFETDQQKAPNNHVKNLLGVGSIPPSADRLSHFTNLIIGSSVPVVFAVGEDVTSTIKTTDVSFLSSLASTRLPNVGLFSKVNSSQTEKEIENAGANRTKPEASRALQRSIFFQNLTDAAAKNLALNAFTRQTSHLGQMTGTSMATPNVAGMLLADFQSKIGLAGIDYEAAYSDPRFTPENLIEAMMRKTTPLRSGNIVDSLRKRIGEVEHKNRPVIKDAEKFFFSFKPESRSRGAQLSCVGLF